MKKFSEEIVSGKFPEIQTYAAARIVKTRIESEEISSQSFEQFQDKEYYLQAIENLDKVLESASSKSITEGDLYFEKYQSFLNSIARKEFAKDYFVNWGKNFLYTLQPDGNEFKRKLSPIAVGLLSASTILTFFPVPVPILGGIVGLTVTFLWLQKRISKDYSVLFPSLAIPTEILLQAF